VQTCSATGLVPLVLMLLRLSTKLTIVPQTTLIHKGGAACWAISVLRGPPACTPSSRQQTVFWADTIRSTSAVVDVFAMYMTCHGLLPHPPGLLCPCPRDLSDAEYCAYLDAEEGRLNHSQLVLEAAGAALNFFQVCAKAELMGGDQVIQHTHCDALPSDRCAFLMAEG
jgi:hypothetical protein